MHAALSGALIVVGVVVAAIAHHDLVHARYHRATGLAITAGVLLVSAIIIHP